MIVKLIVFSCILNTINAQNERPQPSADVDVNLPEYTCLTGYMTDVQSWVNANGTLVRPLARDSTLDLSSKPDALAMLLQNLAQVRRRNRPIKILSMARCGLQEIPQIFSWPNYKDTPLSRSIEYVTFYGNNFDVQIGTGEQYDVFLNATLPVELMANTVQRITKTWSNGFIGIKFPKLKELDLRACWITTLEDRIFAEMPNLESLYLGENTITHIQARAFAGLRKLIHLDLSRNFAYDENSAQKSLIVESMDLFNELKNLHSLDFSFTKLTQRNSALIRGLNEKLQRLSLCHSMVGRLSDAAFNKTSIMYLDLSGNSEVLAEPKALHGLEESLKVLYAEGIDLKTMEPLKNFQNLEILKLTANEINTLPKPVLRTFRNLQILDLSMNRIITWFENNVSLMPKLKLLSLANNNINMITDEMAADIAGISYVNLAGNFIICNCNARDLFELGWQNEMRVTDQVIPDTIGNASDSRWSFHTGFQDFNSFIEHRTPLTRPCDDRNECDMNLELKFEGDLLFLDYSPKEYECLLVAERKSTAFHSFPTCSQEVRMVSMDMVPKARNRLLLIIIPGILLPALAIMFMFRRNLKYFLITMRNSATLSLINKNESHDVNTIFNYDVFVSYCNEDRAWVLDQLLPHVERDCNISVCLHERDFQVGLSILENIVSCMDRSRSIMLILSKRFLLSQWCQFEMHLAQHRLLETRREDLILVLLEEIPKRLRPNTLHYLMLTKTYIVWPKSEEEKSQFWKRLKKSLVTHKLKHTENVSLA